MAINLWGLKSMTRNINDQRIKRLKNTGVDGCSCWDSTLLLLSSEWSFLALRIWDISLCFLLAIFLLGVLSVSIILLTLHCSVKYKPDLVGVGSFSWNCQGESKRRGKLHKVISLENAFDCSMSEDLKLRLRHCLTLGWKLRLGLGEKQNLDQHGVQRCYWRMLSLLGVFWQSTHSFLIIFHRKKEKIYILLSLEKVEQGQVIS